MEEEASLVAECVLKVSSSRAATLGTWDRVWQLRDSRYGTRHGVKEAAKPSVEVTQLLDKMSLSRGKRRERDEQTVRLTSKQGIQQRQQLSSLPL